MKTSLTILFNTFIFSFVLCQSTQIEIGSELTSNHINIPPTKISLILPEGFSKAENFIGIENHDSGINIMEVDGASLQNSTRDLSREVLESQGIIVKRFDKVSVNGLDGYIIEVEKENSTTQLIFGDSTYTFILIGSYPRQNDGAKELIEECLTSVYLNKDQETNPFDEARFEIDLSKTNLEFYQYNINQYFYNTDKLESAYDHPEGATLIIAQIPTDSLVTHNVEDFTKGVFTKMANEVEGLEIIEQMVLKNEETKSYFILSHSKENEKDLYLYVSVIVSKEISFMVNIISFSGLNENMKNAIESVQSMKVKDVH